MKPSFYVAILFSAVSAMAASWPKAGPNYNPPKATVPGSYHQQAGAAGTNTDAAVGKWRATLNDPELTALIDRAVRANLDLKIASSRILEARASRRVTRADLLPTGASSDTVQRVRGGLTSGLFNVNKGSSGRSSLLTPFESNVFQFGFDASCEIHFAGVHRLALSRPPPPASAPPANP